MSLTDYGTECLAKALAMVHKAMEDKPYSRRESTILAGALLLIADAEAAIREASLEIGPSIANQPQRAALREAVAHLRVARAEIEAAK